ncbi:MAG TPA: excinuclease ABC subunit UvrC [Candidatus Limnocylindria bacterium]|nr:excinuclease ABC subunit UvrC [Candidatus Limnocylindria bacterium]
MKSQILNLKSKISDIPKKPGIYQFLDKNGGVIYVGKAKNLKSRVGQYFGSHDNRPQLPYLMAEAVDVNYTVVTNELESAFLENTIIKQYSPKYNIDLKDDKNYAFITIDYSTQIPSFGYTRKFDPKNKQLKYFGPYSAAYKIKNTLNLVRKIFPFCAAQKVSSRPCFYYYMHRCPGVCIGKISLEEYNLQLEKITKFIKGNTSEIISEIKTEMVAAAKAKKFETAARLRDQLRSLEILRERQNVILPKKVDWDLVSLGNSDGYACINLFKIREGKLFDKENFVYELPPGDGEDADVLQTFLERYYLETSVAPKFVYTQIPATDGELIQHIISSRFNHKAEISVPQKGKISKLINLGKLNAEEYLRNWLSSQAGNLDKINQALAQLKETLKLKSIPKRIECYDISNTQGTNPVGSMVVFVDGLPAKSQYRKFKIQGKKTPDDFAMMREMLTRRLARLPNDEKNQESRTKNQTWDIPDLIVIDGGKGQLGVAVDVLSTNHLSLSTIGLAKRIEEIFLPNNPTPIILGHDQPALQLLQRLRDEAHRFGITFHRKLRSKEAIKSALDIIPGVGPKTKKLLKQKFGTINQIKTASLEELEAVVGEKLAATIKKNL